MSASRHPRSRWLRNGVTPRYDERTLAGLASRYHSQSGWHNGAKVRKP